jgi:hypothetical protein
LIIMSHRTQLVLLSLSMVVAGVQLGSPVAAAQEHERARAEHPQGRPGGGERPEGRLGGGDRPGGVVRPDGREGRPSFDGRGQVLDQRYNHGRYYPPMGTVRPTLPGEYRPYYRGRDRYYFNGGVWYAPRGPGFVVVRPPPGLVISVLPPYYSTVWIGGSPYYYADNVYYTWRPDENGYAVVDPPDNADEPSTPPDSPQDASNDLIIYPKNGQSKDQQAADQFECHSWAKSQTGFDPTEPGGGVRSGGDVDRIRNNYDRAMSACLQGRGYQVN